MDTRIALAGMDFYFDQDFDGVIAANNIGVFGRVLYSFPTTVTPASRLATKGVSGSSNPFLPYIDNVYRTGYPVNFDARSNTMTAAVHTRTLTAVKA